MDDQQAKKLGDHLRQARASKGYSARKLSDITGINDATIVRLENGHFASPAPDKLTKIAEALELNSADVFAMADYTAPTDLPSFTPYLRTKYKGLPDEEIERIENYVAKVARKHDIQLDGPAAGEDEAPPN